MKKVLMAIFILMSLAFSFPEKANAIDNHEDIVYMIHNDSCIETANYLYLFYNSPDNETFIEENLNIWLENISQIGPKAFKADIYYLD